MALGIPTWQLGKRSLEIGKGSKNTALGREFRLVLICEPDDHQRNHASDERCYKRADRPAP